MTKQIFKEVNGPGLEAMVEELLRRVKDGTVSEIAVTMVDWMASPSQFYCVADPTRLLRGMDVLKADIVARHEANKKRAEGGVWVDEDTLSI